MNLEKTLSPQSYISTSDSNTDDKQHAEKIMSGTIKKFMDIKTVIDVLKRTYAVLEEISSKRKDSMYFIISNVNNIQKRSSGKKSEFLDDCALGPTMRHQEHHILKGTANSA